MISLPKALLDFSDWLPSDETLTEFDRFEKFYGRPLTARESLMCIPYEVLMEISRNSNGAIDALDVFLLKAAHFAESRRRITMIHTRSSGTAPADQEPTP